jgi:hypothetical protein
MAPPLACAIRRAGFSAPTPPARTTRCSGPAREGGQAADNSLLVTYRNAGSSAFRQRELSGDKKRAFANPKNKPSMSLFSFLPGNSASNSFDFYNGTEGDGVYSFYSIVSDVNYNVQPSMFDTSS